jgi:hypothetical protein
MAKATRDQINKRIETVRQLILSGLNSERIVQSVTAEWKIKPRQGWNYIAKARACIEQLTEEARPYLLAEHVAVRRSLRERARKAGNLRAELAAAQDEAKLFGLYAPTQVDLTWKEVLESHGFEAGSAFEQLVQAAYARATAADGGGRAGGDAATAETAPDAG